MRTEEVLALAEQIVLRHTKALPMVQPQAITISEGEGDEEIQVLLLSDLQIGHQTPSTTVRILRNRAERLTERTIKLATLHRNAYPIRKLTVFVLGDVVQNDRIGRVVSLDELEKVVMDQVFEVAVPVLSKMFLTFAQYYDKVNIYTVAGNHGALGRFAATKTNWDTIAYLAVAGQLANQPTIKFHIERDHFYQKVKIWKWVFLLVHGDQIPVHLTLPWYGLTTKAMRWQGSLPGPQFHYMCLGHFHHASFVDWNEVEIFVNGCFVTDDQWVLKRLGLRGSTTQVTFGVHPRKGVSWRYKVRLD